MSAVLILYFPLHYVCIAQCAHWEGQGGHSEGGDVDLRLRLLLGEEGEDVHAEGGDFLLQVVPHRVRHHLLSSLSMRRLNKAFNYRSKVLDIQVKI